MSSADNAQRAAEAVPANVREQTIIKYVTAHKREKERILSGVDISDINLPKSISDQRPATVQKKAMLSTVAKLQIIAQIEKALKEDETNLELLTEIIREIISEMQELSKAIEESRRIIHHSLQDTVMRRLNPTEEFPERLENIVVNERRWNVMDNMMKGIIARVYPQPGYSIVEWPESAEDIAELGIINLNKVQELCELARRLLTSGKTQIVPRGQEPTKSLWAILKKMRSDTAYLKKANKVRNNGNKRYLWGFDMFPETSSLKEICIERAAFLMLPVLTPTEQHGENPNKRVREWAYKTKDCHQKISLRFTECGVRFIMSDRTHSNEVVKERWKAFLSDCSDLEQFDTVYLSRALLLLTSIYPKVIAPSPQKEKIDQRFWVKSAISIRIQQLITMLDPPKTSIDKESTQEALLTYETSVSLPLEYIGKGLRFMINEYPNNGVNTDIVSFAIALDARICDAPETEDYDFLIPPLTEQEASDFVVDLQDEGVNSENIGVVSGMRV